MDVKKCDECGRISEGTVSVAETVIEIKRGNNTYRATREICEQCSAWFMRGVATSFPEIMIHGPASSDQIEPDHE